MTKYFYFYNTRHPHQSLGNEMPDVVYRTAIGGGATILDKYPRTAKEENPETATAGQAPIIDAKAEGKVKAKSGQRRPAASEVQCAA